MTHLDADVLAEFRAGLITGRRSAQIGAHLAVCQQCTLLGEQLAGVSALLAAVPSAAMPHGVVQRLDAALAGEVARRDQDVVQQPGGDGSRERKRRPGWNWNLRPVALRVLAPVAAIALLVAGGYELNLGGSSTSSQADSSAGQAAAPASGIAGASSGAGTRVRAPLESARPAASAVPTARSHRMSPAVFPVVAGTVNFLPATFGQQVEAALRELGTTRPTQTSSAAVRACVQALAGSVSPVLVESARYHGEPATLIVVPAGSGDTAWMTGSRCSTANHDVLDRTTVPSGISGP